MLCPLCQTEMRISHSAYKLKSVDPPKLVMAQDMVCRYKECPNYNKIVTTVENPIQVETEINQPSE